MQMFSKDRKKNNIEKNVLVKRKFSIKDRKEDKQKNKQREKGRVRNLLLLRIAKNSKLEVELKE